MNKTWLNKNYSNKGFRSCLRLASRRALFAVLLLSIVTPAMASVTNSSGSMAMAMSMSVESADMEQSSCMTISDMSCHHMGGDLLAADVYVEASAEMDCQQECNCCPGVCSAYLPMAYMISALLPEKTTLNKIIINTEAITTTTLFRPPIIH